MIAVQGAIGALLKPEERTMQEQSVVLVQVGERQWTWDVLHSACAVARKLSGRVVMKGICLWTSSL